MVIKKIDKKKFNFLTDKCVSLKLSNELGYRYRLISSINSHGYTPRGKFFTLKTVFKDPSAHKFVSFHCIDDTDSTNQILLNGKKEIVKVSICLKAIINQEKEDNSRNHK